MLNLLFPRICSGCERELSKKEEVICHVCRHTLPLTRYHLTENTAMKDIFYGRFPLQAATALVQFQKKGLAQELLHNLKYRGHEEIGEALGKWLGEEIKDIAPYTTADLVIPVPLHKQKLRKRGYNQVAKFAMEIANALAITYRDDILLKVSKTSSQVFKGRFKRIQDDQIFTVSNPEALKDKHILLVDDIVTTGATLENCASQLLKAEGATISIVTMAKA